VAEADLERALREVAVLVARGVAPEEVFAAISEQSARVCRVGAGAVVRFGAAGPTRTSGCSNRARVWCGPPTTSGPGCRASCTTARSSGS
jgi:hypothetical protein